MIKISLCMIVRDEENVIERCLESIKEVVDEIIIVDTGSTDNTKELIKKYDAKVIDYKWQDNFADARNFSFSMATKDYILWLDADDIVPKKSAEKILDLKKVLDESIDSVTMKYILGMDEYDNITMSLGRNRLVKRNCNFKWVGAVHEYLDVSGKILNTNIEVIHKKDKVSSQRNLNIFRKMIKEEKTFTPRDKFYYGNELFYNELYSEAIKIYEDFLMEDDSWVEDKKTACMNLSICYRNLKETSKVLSTLFRSFEYDAPRADFACCIGDVLLEKDNIEGAIFWYEVAANWMIPQDYLGLINEAYYTWVPNLQLCVSYFKKGDINKSVIHNEEAAKYIPNDSRIKYNRELLKEYL